MIKMMTYLCFLFFYLINLFLILLFGLGKVEDKDDGGKEDGKEPAGGLCKSGGSGKPLDSDVSGESGGLCKSCKSGGSGEPLDSDVLGV